MEKLFTATLSAASTDVYLSGGMDELFTMLSQEKRKLLAVADSNTLQFLPAGVDAVEVIPGEEGKTMDTVLSILSEAKRRGFARDDMFVAIGGGVICDITAFAASLYMRGCQLVLAPTTLLAQVDASLGGKTGVDFEGVKNLIGSFYPAKLVYLSMLSLSTLPEPEFKNGLGEVLKHALLAETSELHTFLLEKKDAVLSRDEQALGTMIRLSLEVKRRYIERDPKETQGIRESLNLGHTFAHGLETMGSLSRFSHGEAVAWGVVKALRLSADRDICEGEFAEKGIELFHAYGFDSEYSVDDVTSYLSAISNDKKKRAGKVRFVLMKGQGEPYLLPLDTDEIRSLV